MLRESLLRSLVHSAEMVDRVFNRLLAQGAAPHHKDGMGKVLASVAMPAYELYVCDCCNRRLRCRIKCPLLMGAQFGRILDNVPTDFALPHGIVQQGMPELPPLVITKETPEVDAMERFWNRPDP